MKAKTLLIAIALGTVVAAPAVYAADSDSHASSTQQSRSSWANSPDGVDQRLRQESNQPGGVGG